MTAPKDPTAKCVWCGYPEPRVPTYSGSSVHETVNTLQTVNDAQEEKP